MDGKLYIKKIIRDDKTVFNFDGEEIYLASENTLLTRPDPDTTSVDYTEVDGGEMIHQRNTIYDQLINGLIVPKTTSYWMLAQRLAAFFQINHTYKIIYQRVDGQMIKISDAWISGGLQIVPVPFEQYSNWSITFSIGNTAWTEYYEDGSGNETYVNNVTLLLASLGSGGEIWDSVGLSSDSVGAEWEQGNGGAQVLTINSTKNVYPVWTVNGPCTNPQLQNNTTGATAQFTRNIAEGQTLKVDFSEGTAYLGTALVSRYLVGDMYLKPGNNTMVFDSGGGTATSSVLSWNNILS